MATKTYKGSSLEAAVRDGALEHPQIQLTGMVKPSDKSGHVQFARGGCETWVDLPTDLIDEAEHLGQQPCRDHAHPVFKVTLKEPKDPAARVLASLLAQPSPTSSRMTPASSGLQGLEVQQWPMFEGSPAFQGDVGGPEWTPAPQQAIPMGRRPGFGHLPGLGGQPPVLGARWCWNTQCCRCLRYERVDNGSASWLVCVQWSCEPCQWCIWPW